jgi:hypothetical protein
MYHEKWSVFNQTMFFKQIYQGGRCYDINTIILDPVRFSMKKLNCWSFCLVSHRLKKKETWWLRVRWKSLLLENLHRFSIFSNKKYIGKEMNIVRIMRVFIQFIRSQGNVLKNNSAANFDLNLNWMTRLEYNIYDGTSSIAKRMLVIRKNW